MSIATPHDTTIGSRVRARREQQGMTQAVLAAHIGVTFQQVQKYERGTNRIAAGGPVAALCATPSGVELARAWLALTPQLQRAVLHLAQAAAPPTITGSPSLKVDFQALEAMQ